jgi:hypothetical protein
MSPTRICASTCIGFLQIFNEFVAKLISKEQEEVLRAGDPVYEEFKQRLERFKRERKQETGNSD